MLLEKRLRDQNWQIKKGKELSGKFENTCHQTSKTCPGSEHFPPVWNLSCSAKKKNSIREALKTKQKNTLLIVFVVGQKKKPARVDIPWVDTELQTNLKRVEEEQHSHKREGHTDTYSRALGLGIEFDTFLVRTELPWYHRVSKNNLLFGTKFRYLRGSSHLCQWGMSLQH